MPSQSKVLFSAVASNGQMAPFVSEAPLPAVGDGGRTGVGVGSLALLGVLPGSRLSIGSAVGSSRKPVHRGGDGETVAVFAVVASSGDWVAIVLGEAPAAVSIVG